MGNMIDLRLHIAIGSMDGRYLAVAPHLGVVGHGKSREEAVEDFNSALECFLSWHNKNGTLSKRLQSLGWRLKNHEPEPPLDFHVPTYFLGNGTGRSFETQKRNVQALMAC